MKFYLELWIAFNLINFPSKSTDTSNHISTLMPQIVYCIIKRTFTMIITWNIICNIVILVLSPDLAAQYWMVLLHCGQMLSMLNNLQKEKSEVYHSILIPHCKVPSNWQITSTGSWSINKGGIIQKQSVQTRQYIEVTIWAPWGIMSLWKNMYLLVSNGKRDGKGRCKRYWLFWPLISLLVFHSNLQYWLIAHMNPSIAKLAPLNLHMTTSSRKKN
jgi:hypothetical protein